MATYNKYQLGIEKMVEGNHTALDTWQIILSNTAPNPATNTTAVSATELGTAGGYTLGGKNCTVTSAVSTGGVYKLLLASPGTWTANAGGFTFQYVILYNLTQTQCIGWWDYGSPVVMSGANGDTFTPTLDAVGGTFTIT